VAEAADGEKDEGKKNEKKAFPVIPIPIFITEPAIGYGLGAAVGYFHPQRGGGESASSSPAFTTRTPPGRSSRHPSKPPPVMTGVAAAYTEKGTWAVGVGHTNNWRRDSIRYSGGLGYAKVVSTFYFLDRPFDFNLEGWLTMQDLKFRISRSDFFVGFKWSYINAEGIIRISEDPPVDFPASNISDSGLAIQANWDSRDNIMTPNRGQLAAFELWRYDEAIGGDYDYWKAGFKVTSFHPFANRFILGLRLDLDAVSGEPPLWGYPWITLRGIPALRFQNELVGVVEAELRWNIFDKWGVVGFAGVGGTRGDTIQYEDQSGIVAGGVGGRYFFRPQDSLWIGIDVAKGPEDTYAYIQIGQAW
jgi:hypothetical protein